MDNKSFVRKRGKWTIYDLEKDGIPFKILIEGEDEGKIKQIIQKPNFKQMENAIVTSGLHIVVDYPDRNHYDHYDKKGNKTRTEKTQDNPY